jgi:hypothetical protein
MRCAANGGSNLTSPRAVGQFGVSSSAIAARVRPVIIGAACIECQSWRRRDRKAPFEAPTASSSWWPAMLSLVFVVHWWIGLANQRLFSAVSARRGDLRTRSAHARPHHTRVDGHAARRCLVNAPSQPRRRSGCRKHRLMDHHDRPRLLAFNAGPPRFDLSQRASVYPRHCLLKGCDEPLPPVFGRYVPHDERVEALRIYLNCRWISAADSIMEPRRLLAGSHGKCLIPVD